MQSLDLTDATVEQLRAYTRSGETPSQAIRRLLDAAEPEPDAAPEPVQLAESVLTVADLRVMDAHGYDAAEYLRAEHDIDPVEFTDETALREAMREEA